MDRHEALIRVKDFCPAILEALQDITTWSDAVTAAKAEQYLSVIQNPKFAVALFVGTNFAHLFLSISQALQQVNMDLLLCLEEIFIIKNVLRDRRKNAEAIFSPIFLEAKRLCNDEITILRRVRRQSMRDN